MKSFLFISAVLMVVQAQIIPGNTGQNQISPGVRPGKNRCMKQSDCGPNRCCSYEMLSDISYCINLRTQGQMCMTGPAANVLDHGRFSISCPCKSPLQCLSDSDDIHPNGMPRNPTCQLPGYDEKPDGLWKQQKSDNSIRKKNTNNAWAGTMAHALTGQGSQFIPLIPQS